ncbi:PAAR domain-containing protein [Massilia niabensis]|uniref:PAAR domain-containing protein n=1 Tax=Massilia niabensis TaxID=544910 RepID=A0ABW0LAX3_9BURK
MLKRYLITVGATTTAGGKVTSGCAFMSIGDAPVALEGDTLWCPACLSEGVIALDGPRLSSTFEGREEALGDDLCMCKCSPPPRLVAAQGFEWQEIDSDWHAEQSAATASAA